MRKNNKPLTAETFFVTPEGDVLPVAGMPKDELRRRATEWNRAALLGAGFKENKIEKPKNNDGLDKRKRRNKGN